MYRVKRKTLRPFLLKEPLSKPKTGLQNLDFHQFFCSNRLLNRKYIWKGIACIWHLKKKSFDNFFSRHELPKAKIWLKNSTFINFSVANTCKRMFMYWIWWKSLEPFLSYSLLVSFSVGPTPFPVLRFLPNLYN